MLTNDSIYWKPLVPVITIKNTANTSTLYTYSSFTGTATGVTTVFPHFCNVSLSQSIHGEFTVQFSDTAKALEAAGITVNSRVQIDCGKQSGSTTRLISGLVRTKGYSRGADNKVNYTISGSSTGIRLNEIIRYVVSEATKMPDGVTPDKTDATRKADTLLATNLAQLTADGILSIANLATNSDVETFIANLSIEYGQLQDIVNYIQDQSGGRVIVDTNDLVNLKYEIKNTLTGRGFTIKNKHLGSSTTDDADDTMYLRGKNWSYQDDFYNSNNYSNKLTAILRAENRPASPLDLGFITLNSWTETSTSEHAVKFRPPHTRFTPGDIYVVASQWSNGVANVLPASIVLRICKDSSGVPQNANGIVALIVLFPTNFQDPLPTAFATETITLINDEYFFNTLTGAVGDFYLDTTKDYWLIFSHDSFSANHRFTVGRNMNATGTPPILAHTSNFSTTTNGGTNWTTPGSPSLPCFGVGRYRATPYQMWDPKASLAVQSGLSELTYIESVVTDTAIEVTTRDSIIRQLAGQLTTKARPTTSYTFPRVTAPNIPPFPGDPIIISDSVLGLSTTSNQVAITACGDISYSWGEIERGNYEAPTILSINCSGVHSRYR